MSSPTISKKRKRDDPDAGSSKRLIVESSSLSKSQVGPAIGNFPCLKPPRSTAFDVYVRNGDEERPFVEQQTTLAGEAEKVEFEGSTNDMDSNTGSHYFVALYRPSAGKITLQPAPLYSVTRQVKALKAFRSKAPSAEDRIAARNALGETFGTRKAKAAIRAYERNKVDVGAMENVAGTLQDSIDVGTENLPSKDKAQEVADSARLIPAYDANAMTPEDAYPLHNIIPEPELNALDSLASSLKSAENVTARLKCLPFAQSEWIKHHLLQAFRPGSKLRNQTLKVIAYIAAMFNFRRAASGPRGAPERAELLKKMERTPEIVVDGLLSRFTETPRGSSTAKMTGATETLLFTHMFALCLKLDSFATDTALIAKDLRMSVTKVNTLFKSLGCTVSELPALELKRLGLSETASSKRAVLKAPLKFPKPRAKRRA
ncbi:Rpa49 subunit specific to nuclear RNA polymerase I [Vararia minispora EC-137]|uniref:Rpa49 subunit specific to nuclear RNA polymerase I n=1 Tax=Vararia minispora EC-137 TaxID=1314806 RepID=A0ACB8QI16_9AGAM|nr:Rpa49 subunit specific to nuclear RNA polymerase I [Vararia minispora EC-137]